MARPAVFGHDHGLLRARPRLRCAPIAAIGRPRGESRKQPFRVGRGFSSPCNEFNKLLSCCRGTGKLYD
jgi:hypothetical protein